MALVLLLALGYWLWFGLTQRSRDGDEGISILAAQGVLEHGYPRLPSGYLYYRAYLPNYLLAASIAVLGLGDVAVMLPSLLMGLGALWLVYLFCRDALASPWVGVAAAALLLAVKLETFYATSARMYVALQFFSILSIYWGYRGFVLGQNRFRFLAGGACVAAFLSHEVGFAVCLSIAASVLIIRTLDGHKLSSLLGKASLALTVAATLFVIVYMAPDKKPSITANGGQFFDPLSLSFNLDNWLQHLDVLNRTVPFVLAFLFIPVVMSCKRFRSQRGHAFAVLNFACCSLMVLFVLKSEPGTGRYWFFLLPLLAALGCYGFAKLLQAFSFTSRASQTLSWKAMALALGLGMGLNLSPYVGAAELRLKPVQWFGQIMSNGYGLPCQGAANCDKQVKETYDALRPFVQAQDLIITSNQNVTRYYLGRIDGYLRERLVAPGEFSAFESLTDEYDGVPIFDTLEELRALHANPKRVWVILDYKTALLSSPQTLQFLRSTFTIHVQDRFLTVYVNCQAPPCSNSPNSARRPAGSHVAAF